MRRPILYLGVLLLGICSTGRSESQSISESVAGVYAVMLSDSRCSGVGAAGARGRDPVVVREAVIPSREWWWNAFPHTDFLRDIPVWLPGVRPETVQSFTKEIEPSLDLHLVLAGSLQLAGISRGEVDALAGDAAFWPAFYKRYPSASGLIELSPIGLAPDGREALGYCGFLSESLSGSGFLVLLRGDGQRWKAVAWRQVWQS